MEEPAVARSSFRAPRRHDLPRLPLGMGVGDRAESLGARG